MTHQTARDVEQLIGANAARVAASVAEGETEIAGGGQQLTLDGLLAEMAAQDD